MRRSPAQVFSCDTLVSGSLFEECYASKRGGGLHQYEGNLTVSATVFANNSAGGDNDESGEPSHGRRVPSIRRGRERRVLTVSAAAAPTALPREAANHGSVGRSVGRLTASRTLRSRSSSTSRSRRITRDELSPIVWPSPRNPRLVATTATRTPLDTRARRFTTRNPEDPVGEGGGLSLRSCSYGFLGAGLCGVNGTNFLGNDAASKGGAVQISGDEGNSHVEFSDCMALNNTAGENLDDDSQGDGGTLSVGTGVTMELVNVTVRGSYAGNKVRGPCAHSTPLHPDCPLGLGVGGWGAGRGRTGGEQEGLRFVAGLCVASFVHYYVYLLLQAHASWGFQRPSSFSQKWPRRQ